MALGIVMFGSRFSLSDGEYAAMGCTLILLLGWLGILVSLAYRLTALALLVAAFGFLMPDSIKEHLGGVYENDVIHMKDATSPAYATQTGAPAIEAAMSLGRDAPIHPRMGNHTDPGSAGEHHT
jgi:hypothetical protein